MKSLKLVKNPCNGHVALTVPFYIAEQIEAGTVYKCNVQDGKIIYSPVGGHNV